jgi:nucleoid-associated protein YgaU
MKINPIAVFTALALAAAGAFGYMTLQLPERPADKAAVKIVSVGKPAAALAELKKPAEQKIVSAVSNTVEIKVAPKPPAIPTAIPTAVIAPSFDTVRVETSGDAVIAGHAAAGTEVLAKLNGAVVATAKTAADGSFVMIPAKPLSPGAGTLSLETNAAGAKQISETTVAVAIVAPVQPAKIPAAPPAAVAMTPPPPPQVNRIIVQPGNNLWTLSRQLYGAGKQYTVIYEANKNQIRNPQLIYPGQIITAPNAEKTP